jgi:ATP-dependent RNA helicase SUPV3L1/SUV3
MTTPHAMQSEPPSGTPSGEGVVTAVLGPTNTGKTYLAMDRMLGHATGMIGFPLRLLARENYDRVVRVKGANAVALITGEEKIIPAAPRYYVCTVESMPVDRDVAFLAVDEIQLAADVDRGHVFTDRLLHARGRVETMFLGAETIRPLIRKLVPHAQFVTRPRFSKLVYTGPKKLTRLPRRSAVVAFSVSEVYGIAELIRRHRGGAAVVMGALSPRTRNAQVALYQGGDVDYMVATDAIGMGLNMDVDHVAFASTSKFDGHAPRALVATEVAQIAGRAGRHMNDGTFGVTGDVPGMDPDIVARVEAHDFPPLTSIFWRNTNLRFTSVDALRASLRVYPPVRGLTRPPPAEDQLVLDAMLKDTTVYDRARDAARIRMLWDVAQVPDFRKLTPELHARLMTQIFTLLTQGDEVLPTDWVADQVARVDRTDGDIHALMDRIAATRVWTYIAHRGAWLTDAAGWQARTREVEDRLSDALHAKLTQQFVDKRTAHLVKRLRGDDLLDAAVADDGVVEVDGHRLGHLEGLRFKAERTGLRTADRAVLNAAAAALRPVLAKRAGGIVAASDDAFALDDQARILWRGAAVASLEPGPERLKPALQVLGDERLESSDRLRIEERLRTWLADHIRKVLGPLVKATTQEMPAPVRGIVFQLSEHSGAVPRANVEAQLAALGKDERERLAQLGIRFGLNMVFMPALMKAAAVRLRGLLWIAAHREMLRGGSPPLPPEGRVTFAIPPDTPRDFMAACGYVAVDGAAYRADMIERFAAIARKLARDKVKIMPPEHLSLLGMNAAAAVPVLKMLGFKARVTDEGLTFALRWDKRPGREKGAAPVGVARPDSPFAKLRDLLPTP